MDLSRSGISFSCPTHPVVAKKAPISRSKWLTPWSRSNICCTWAKAQVVPMDRPNSTGGFPGSIPSSRLYRFPANRPFACLVPRPECWSGVPDLVGSMHTVPCLLCSFGCSTDPNGYGTGNPPSPAAERLSWIVARIHCIPRFHLVAAGQPQPFKIRLIGYSAWTFAN